jgi:periplasmic protein TonB
MSYASARAGGPNRMLTISAIALLQAGVAIALVQGLAVKFLPEETRPTPQATLVPIDLPPPPPQPVEPEIVPEQNVPDSFIDTIAPPLPLPKPTMPMADQGPSQPKGVPTIGTFPGTEATGSGTIVPVPTPDYQPAGPKPRNDPAGWVTTSDYPSRDLHDGNQGRVSFELSVGANGKIQGCRIVESSGFAGLDAATCKNVSRRARFKPATDAMGDTVGGTYGGTIRWVIPRD